MTMSENKYRQYEYMELPAKSDNLSLKLDMYESFGWEVMDEKITLRRDRHIINKVELTRLQRNAEACFLDIKRMEKSQETKAAMYAIICGLVGCGFLAAAVFSYLHTPPLILLMILFAIPGFTLWILPLRIKRIVLEKEAKRLSPLIEGKYDEIYERMDRGRHLWNE